MIRLGAIRDALWCLIALGIVACAATPLPASLPDPLPAPMPVDKFAGMRVETRAHEARQALAAAQLEAQHPARTARGLVLTLDDASFDPGRAALKPGAIHSVEELAQFLNEYPERRVLIEAFTDSRGSNAYNIELSQSRADAVAMVLIHRGIDPRRMGAIGFGARFPVASEANAAGQERNRRVEITVTHGDEAIPYRKFAVVL